ncbi:MAG: AgmX/PglI C-terminal domain-containing protein [Kofleriaceae bacterium]|nr:AgmX/PglI C-terminal domain-containing protein [Kofleriaceae bacterium]
MRSFLGFYAFVCAGSAICCGGPQRSSSTETRSAAGPKEVASVPLPVAKEEDSEAKVALLDSPSPYTATFRIDATQGGLGESRSSEVLHVSGQKLEACAYKADFSSHWTVGLVLDVDASGAVKLKTEGAKPDLIACLERVVLAMNFPTAGKATRVNAAIMIQYPESTTRTGMAPPPPPEAFKSLAGVGIGSTGGYGYGLSGVGPGGGGTGYGTIGLGSIGNGRGYQAKGPRVRPGQLTSTGALSRTIIRRVIRRNINRFRYCYEKQLRLQPRLSGRVSATFTIGANGRVSKASATGMPTSVSRCVKMAILRMQFPAPQGGGVVKVSYPFFFSPALPSPPRPPPRRPRRQIVPPPVR